jgi:hypothetical protein
MRTSGHGNDGLMIFVSLGVAVVVGVSLLGGPPDALEAANTFLGRIARDAMEIVNGLF